MKLTPTKRKMLLSINECSRRPVFFSSASGFSLSQERVTELLAEMVESNLLFESEGSLHITLLGRHALDIKGVAKNRIATLEYEPYKVGMCDQYQQPQRPGSDHSGIKSKGFFC